MRYSLKISGDTIELVRYILECYASSERFNGENCIIIDAVISVEGNDEQYLNYETAIIHQ